MKSEKTIKPVADLNNHYNTWPNWLWGTKASKSGFPWVHFPGRSNPPVPGDLVIDKLEIRTAIGRHSDAEQMYIWKRYDMYDDDHDAHTFWVVVLSIVCLCQVNQLCIVCKISWRRGKTGTNYWEMFFMLYILSIHHCTLKEKRKKKKISYLQIYRYHYLLHLLYIFILWS